MNNLEELMKAKGVTPDELSKETGLAVTNIRRLMKEDSVAFAYKRTIQGLAKALGVTPHELIEGGETFEKKLLHAEITSAIQTLSTAFRRHCKEPLYLRMSIFTQDVGMEEEVTNEVPDFYMIHLSKSDTDNNNDYVPIIDEAHLLYFDEKEPGKIDRNILCYRSENRTNDNEVRPQ